MLLLTTLKYAKASKCTLTSRHSIYMAIAPLSYERRKQTENVPNSKQYYTGCTIISVPAAWVRIAMFALGNKYEIRRRSSQTGKYYKSLLW